MNRVIAAADPKTGLVLAAQGVVLAGTASSLRSGLALSTAARVGAVAVVVVAGVAVLLLGVALWPRWRSSAPVRFALPGLQIGEDGTVHARPPLPQLAEQAWLQADALATIAWRYCGVSWPG